MSRTINRLFLLGNVGRAPDIQVTSGGTKVAHISLATNRWNPGSSGADKERTDFHRLTCWNRLAQFVEDHVTTGDRIYIEGTLTYDSYERDGVTIPTAEVTVRELVMLTPSKKDAGE